jgi:hypothetical protein
MSEEDIFNSNFSSNNQEVPNLDYLDSLIPTSEIKIKLGDIIQIDSPNNDKYNLNVFFTEYIDDEIIKLVDINNGDRQTIDLDQNGCLIDTTIYKIFLLSRSEKEGYARQNNLLPNTYVKLSFSDEIEIVGKIMNLEEDMIEIITNDEHTIFIDFEYKGIPKNIPLEKITIIDKLSIQESLLLRSETKEREEKRKVAESEEKEVSTASIEFTPEGNTIINIPENPIFDSNPREELKKLYSYSSTMVGKRVEFYADVEVGRNEQRFGIEMQTNDLLDELLSTIPDSARTTVVMERIHRVIRRFKELREIFSTFDKNGNITGYKNFTASYKPLAEHLENLDTNLRWIVPVVKQKTKIYESSSIINDNIISQSNLKIEMDDYDSSLKIDTGNNRYTTFYNGINKMFTPFESIGKDNSILKSDYVNANLEAIVDNLEDYYTYVYKKTKNGAQIAKQRFVIQKYNLGMTKISNKILSSGKSVYMRESFTSNDTLSAKSVIMLPKPVIEFSRIDLPGTNILTRSGLSKNWLYNFKLLSNKTSFKKTYIDNVNKEYDYEKKTSNEDAEEEKEDGDNEGNNSSFLDSATSFEISTLIDANYKTILETIIPRSVSIIRMFKHKYIGYNFYDMFAFYEPFMIYSDNITYSGRTRQDKIDEVIKGGSYQELRIHIRDNIKEYSRRFVQENKNFQLLKNVKSQGRKKTTILGDIQQDILVKIMKEYRIFNEAATASELLSKIISIDNGAFYTSILSFLMAHLYTPELANILKMADSGEEAFTNSKSCVTRVIAKKYTTLSSLQKDNGKDEVYFDKDYDTTPYEILKKHSETQKKMSNSAFLDYLSVVLKNEHGARDDELAESMAKTIIAKRKLVEENNYAVLVIYPQLKSIYDDNNLSKEERDSVEIESDVKKRISYFIRKGDNWVRDTTISDSDLNSELFCNVDNKCFYDKNNEFCDVMDNAAERMKRIAKKNLKKEFDTTIALSIEDFKKDLYKNFDFKEGKLIKTRILKEIKDERFSVYAFNLGTKAVTTDIVISPYAKIRDMILSQADFSKKQDYIVTFKNKYCREAIVNDIANESIHWYYCKETNVKLLPVFLYTLAKAFFDGNYELTLDVLCSTNGKKSDDGESIVDKHSGYVIQFLDFSAEEGFDDQGFKINTRSIITQEADEIIKEAINAEIEDNQLNLIKPPKTVKRVFENQTDKYIYNVSKAIAERLNIEYVGIEDIILSHTSRIIANKLKTEEQYRIFTEKTSKTDKKSVSYETYVNRNIFFFTVAVTFIIIQANIPSFRPQKTFPGCVFSLSGYPLDQTGNQTGLKYICCMLEKMKNKVSEPWKSVSKLNNENLLTNVVEWLDKQVLPDQNISKLLDFKRQYLILQPDNYIPEEHDVDKWLLFQPPLIKSAIEKTVSGVSRAFEMEIVNTIKTGHHSQHVHLGTMYKKIIEHTYSLIDNVNNIVALAGREATLKAGTIIFLENSCCEETKNNSKTIEYFAQKDENIHKNIDFVKKYENIYNEIKSLSIPSFITSKTKKTDIIPGNNEYSENNIYSAFIYYCNLNSDLPIPDDLQKICQEKIVGLNTMSLDQMIETLNDKGKKQTKNSLMTLMGKIAERNLVSVSLTADDAPSFEDIFNPDIKSNQDIIIKYIVNALKDKEKIVRLNIKLDDLNDRMFNDIREYLKTYGRLSKPELLKIEKYLENVTNWSNGKNIPSFIKNTVHNITQVVPSMLVNNSSLKNMNAMKHWDFAPRHNEILISSITNYFASINSYNRENKMVGLLFEEISKNSNMRDINTLVDQLVTITELSPEIINSVYKYCYLSVFSKIISESEDNKYEGDMNEIEVEVEDADLVEIEIVGNQQEFFQNVSNLIIIILNTDMENKETMNLNYQDLIDMYHKDGLAEKKRMTDRLKNMQKDELGVEVLMKKYKLGVWNLGEQKGVYQYDKTLYEAEVETDINTARQRGVDANELGAEEQRQLAENETNEAFGDVGHDGDYYPEDREEVDE